VISNVNVLSSLMEAWVISHLNSSLIINVYEERFIDPTVAIAISETYGHRIVGRRVVSGGGEYFDMFSTYLYSFF